MKALTFQLALPRLAAAKVLGSLDSRGFVSRLGPLGFGDVPDARLLGDRWVIAKTNAAGICGSDVKQVYLDAAVDNPMKSLISFPHVLGHEMVGTIVEVGSGVRELRVGDRIANYPWLTCAVRGLPECAACKRGDLTLCGSITEGAFAPGMHAGTCKDVSGGFAEYFPAHESMCIKIPDELNWEQAVLADPFSVMLRAILKAPPARGETVMVYGCGVLGLAAIHLIARLFPGVAILGVDTNDRAEPLARKLGASEFFAGGGTSLIERAARHLGVPLRRPVMAVPWVHDGVDRVYDTVGAGATLETAIRLLRPKGTLVIVGVAPPSRFEWTPLYFKEITLVGSSGCGIEELEGSRKNGFAHYLDLAAEGRIDGTPMITHHFALADYQNAFVTAHDKRRTGSVKVLFDFE